MKFGLLDFMSVEDNLNLIASPVKKAIEHYKLGNIFVTKIDPQLADTAAFCEAYNIGLDASANCVIVEAKRADKVWYAACLVLATDRADVNGIIRRHLEARRASFAPMNTAVSLSQMEYGGITPIGLPADWPILVDNNVASKDQVVIGSGIRGSKILIPGKALASLPNAETLHLIKTS
jgi:prolyl-tRNA editing enzyme YbaK/EbsC (Cys-tRNA(Pro) deacylase)